MHIYNFNTDSHHIRAYCYHDTIKKMLRNHQPSFHLVTTPSQNPHKLIAPKFFLKNKLLQKQNPIYIILFSQSFYTQNHFMLRIPPSFRYPDHQVEIHPILLYTLVYTSMQYMSTRWPRCPVSWQKYENIFKPMCRYASQLKLNIINITNVIL